MRRGGYTTEYQTVRGSTEDPTCVIEQYSTVVYLLRGSYSLFIIEIESVFFNKLEQELGKSTQKAQKC